MFEGMGLELLLGAVLILAGFVLAGIEMFVPGFSVPGICALICFVVGTYLCAQTAAQAIAIIAVIIAVVTVMFVVIVRLFQKGKIKTLLQLKDEVNSIGVVDLGAMLGMRGVTRTDLHPVGTARFDGADHEVISAEGFIPRNTEIVVIKASANKLTVRPYEGEPISSETKEAGETVSE